MQSDTPWGEPPGGDETPSGATGPGDAPPPPPPAAPAPPPPPAPYPTPYGAPPYQQGYYGQPPPRTTNGMAVASLVLGIVWVYWIGSILALVFGYIAKNQIDASGGTQQGRGMAVAGIVLGWVGVGFLILFLVLFALGATLFGFAASGALPR